MQFFFNPCILAVLCLAVSADPSQGGVATVISPNGLTSAAGIKKHDMMRREDTLAGAPAALNNTAPSPASSPLPGPAPNPPAHTTPAIAAQEAPTGTPPQKALVTQNAPLAPGTPSQKAPVAQNAAVVPGATRQAQGLPAVTSQEAPATQGSPSTGAQIPLLKKPSAAPAGGPSPHAQSPPPTSSAKALAVAGSAQQVQDESQKALSQKVRQQQPFAIQAGVESDAHYSNLLDIGGDEDSVNGDSDLRDSNSPSPHPKNPSSNSKSPHPTHQHHSSQSAHAGASHPSDHARRAGQSDSKGHSAHQGPPVSHKAHPTSGSGSDAASKGQASGHGSDAADQHKSPGYSTAHHPSGISESDAAFARYDADGNGDLDQDECKKFMVDMGVKEDSCKILDSDGNGVLSRVGFKRVMDDQRVFKASDVDASGFLEKAEIENVVQRAGLTDFDWKQFDHDKDGKLSMGEFLKAGPAAATAAAMQAQSLIEEDDGELFKGEKEDGSFLEEGDDDDANTIHLGESHSDKEALSLLEGDGDGDNDEDQSSDASASEYPDSESASDSSSEYPDSESDSSVPDAHNDPEDFGAGVVWRMFNTNGDEVLDTNELAKLARDAGLPADFDVKEYDKDQDGKLNWNEFVKMGRAGKRKASLAFTVKVRNKYFEEDATMKGHPLHKSESQSDGALKDKFFESADEDGSGYLDEKEIRKFMKGMPAYQGFDWKPYDKDADGQLSVEEFVTMTRGD